jgi:hypothetical protein
LFVGEGSAGLTTVYIPTIPNKVEVAVAKIVKEKRKFNYWVLALLALVIAVGAVYQFGLV